ncbi:5-hydroxytryptamine receptor [Orchesella cincta]|uniref:5-hydroxytryptamine receptor n=1 Tax=Orchesella cincta TaxID=48709 RepID=A0A1D2NLZ7_ORCCI|nr:5-hydroxytryptamine receptor [Orchesella cincta]
MDLEPNFACSTRVQLNKMHGRNVFVIVAVFIEKNLRNVANYLVVSLAVADLMVACLVMPLGAIYEFFGKCEKTWPGEIKGEWLFGAIVCEIWTSLDVLCCSASILHLLSVAVDRYWAVTRINWTVNRNKSSINFMIFLVWLVAAMVSAAPLFGWKDPHFLERIEEGKCLVSQDVGYQIFATCATFYVPLFFILLLYWRIWKTARNRIRHRVGKIPKKDENHSRHLPTSASTPNVSSKPLVMSTTFSDELSCHTATVETSMESMAGNHPHIISNNEQELQQLGNSPVVSIAPDEESGSGVNPSVGLPDSQIPQSPTSVELPEQAAVIIRPTHLSVPSPSDFKAAPGANQVSTPVRNKPTKESHKKQKESLEAKRERKAAKTLAIITGAFVVCWLPFFVMALGLAVCGEACNLPDYVISAFQWLGYFNSIVNPIIYTLFSPDFRKAFKRILCGQTSNSRRRNY